MRAREPKPGRGRPTGLAVVAATLLLVGTGCTSDDKSTAQPPPSPSASETTPAPPPPSVPLTVKVTRVHGTLSAKSQAALAGNVRSTLATYLDGAFLTGSYPRSDFNPSYAAFTPGVRKRAVHDAGLLTNATWGPSTESVRATRRTAYLSVLSPFKVAAGVTAKVDLLFLVDRGDKPAERVRLTGRLLLTRNKSNGWSIFGYDLARSDTPVGGGS